MKTKQKKNKVNYLAEETAYVEMDVEEVEEMEEVKMEREEVEESVVEERREVLVEQIRKGEVEGRHMGLVVVGMAEEKSEVVVNCHRHSQSQSPAHHH